MVEEPETSPRKSLSLEYKDPLMNPIYKYLQNDTIPDDDAEANRISQKVKMSTFVEGIMYKRGTQGVLMRCISPKEGLNLLNEIHGYIYGAHASGFA